jgi:hypothetical protein
MIYFIKKVLKIFHRVICKIAEGANYISGGCSLLTITKLAPSVWYELKQTVSTFFYYRGENKNE